MTTNKNKNNMKKLCVGVESVEQLWAIQEHRFNTLGYCCAYTTMRPQAEARLIEKGSLYWIIKGQIKARQKIIGFESYRDETDRKRTIILLDNHVIKTEPHAHRPFQGWRYLADNEIPDDIDTQKYKDLSDTDLSELKDLGLL